MTSEPEKPTGWSAWYRFARDELGFGHDECVEYANLRFVEEQNRAALHAASHLAPLSRGTREKGD